MKSIVKKNKNVEDFLADEDFRKWVLTNDKDLEYFWCTWLNSHPESKKMAMQAKEIILSLKFNKNTPQDIDEKQVFELVLKEKFSTRNKLEEVPERNITKYDFTWFKVAAVLALAFLSVYILFYEKDKQDIASEKNTVQWILKENPSTHRSSFNLPDGSIVTLNINSSIYYPEEFTENERLVEVKGEAYFEVVKDPQKPFIVTSKNFKTTALGTSFNVRALDSEYEEEIALVTGRVKVEYLSQSKMNEDFLEPGERLLFDTQKEIIRKSTFNPEAIIGWKDGVLLFENDDYKTVVKKIERWYGVDIHLINQPDENWEINGRFVNKSLYELLSSLRYTHEVDFKFTGNKTIELKL